MRYTNKYDLPEEVIAWLMIDDYDYMPGVYSITTLMKPVRSTILSARHYDDVTMDYSDLIAMRLGSSIHDSFEKIDLEFTKQEERLYHEIDGHRISGKYDILRNVISGKVAKLKDLKSTSAWSWVYDDKSEEYIKQLSGYRYLLHHNGYEVEDIADVIFVFTDWKRVDAKRNDKYPPIRIMDKSFELWNITKTDGYLRGRIAEIVNHQDTPDDDLPYCTQSELWQKPPEYAVMKDGGKRALSGGKFDNQEDAQVFRDEKGPGHFIETRIHKAKRCPYCNGRMFCNQYDDLVNADAVDV